MMGALLYAEESYAIRGAIMEVYREMGCGLLEAPYQECLAIELGERGIPFIREGELKLSYKGRLLQCTYRYDFVCFGKVLVELKAVKELAGEHRAQLHNYLKASGLRLGFLANFGHHPDVEIERVVM